MMPLLATGQWLIDAGMRMMSLADQVTWHRWARQAGWALGARETEPLPPEIAQIAIHALTLLMKSIEEDIIQQRLSEDNELDACNDTDMARAVIADLQKISGIEASVRHRI